MRSSRFPAITATLALIVICSSGAASARSQGQRPLAVSFAPAAPRPGDVVQVIVSGAASDDSVSAMLFDRKVTFEYDERRQHWRSLVGIDLETKPGAYSMHVTRPSTSAPLVQPLEIVPRQFRVRRLRVRAAFVDPPEAALEQIKRDSDALAEAYARSSPKQWKGAFLQPVDGTPSSNFGTRSYYNGQQRSPHSGVDFGGEVGTPVRASNYGTVVLALPMYFTGNTVIVDHGMRLFSVFAHLSAFNVSTGDHVAPDTVVGLLGATGRVTGPHLHWAVRLGGARVDPISLIRATRE